MFQHDAHVCERHPGGGVGGGVVGLGGLVPTPSDHLGDGNGSSVHLVLRCVWLWLG